MKKIMQWMFAAILFCGSTVFTSCHREDDPETNEVRLVRQDYVGCSTNGDTVMALTQNYVWEKGLLRSINGTMYDGMSGQTSDLGTQSFVYDKDNNCIEFHYIADNFETHEYFTYVDGRITKAVELNGADTARRTTVTAYTPDGHIQAFTVEYLSYDIVVDYQFTWQNGDMIKYTKHPVQPAGDDVYYNIEYDSYPNVHTGMPLTSALFDPDMIASYGSLHNWKILNNVHTYSNGRLVKTSSTTNTSIIDNYYTYSDGTTGRE